MIKVVEVLWSNGYYGDGDVIFLFSGMVCFLEEWRGIVVFVSGFGGDDIFILVIYIFCIRVFLCFWGKD